MILARHYLGAALFYGTLHALLVEYLINVRGMTIDELLRQPPDFRVVEAEVIAALRENEQAFLDKLSSRIGIRRDATFPRKATLWPWKVRFRGIGRAVAGGVLGS